MLFHTPPDKDDAENSSVTPYSLPEHTIDQELPSKVQRTITPVVSTSPSRESASSSSTEDMEAVFLSDESCQYNQEELSQGQPYDLEDIDETSEVQSTFQPTRGKFTI